MKRFVVVFALLAAPLRAAPPTTCGLPDDYSRALCAYQQRDFVTAERVFGSIVDAGEEAPQTLKGMYFLARTYMKTGRFDEAAGLLVRIYETDRTFYGSWSCDFLLGECRRALGKD